MSGSSFETATAPDSLRFALLNDWQRDFPLVAAPFVAIAKVHGSDADTVLAQYRSLLAGGAISRIGGVWGCGAAGNALLCAFAVPAHRLEAVAAVVSAHPGVNHNYEREHRYNLWFVLAGRNAEAVAQALDDLEARSGCPALRLRMRRAYRIDLGFDLRADLAQAAPPAVVNVPAVDLADSPLAALLEDGLPLIERPYDAWSQALGCSGEVVLATLRRWLRQGTLRRFGAIVRHHEAGFRYNAMTVFDVPDHLVDACGAALAAQHGVTLAYRRERSDGWPYNLYCMIHGRDRAVVHAAIDAATRRCRLDAHPRAVLFSRRRFKQTGARYFPTPVQGGQHDPA